MKMSRMMWFIVLLVCVLLVSFATAAGVDKQLYYQKKVTASPGIGTVTCTFSLFDAETGGLLVWAETKGIAMTSTTRLITTMLGDTVPFDTMQANFAEQLWVQTDCNNVTLGARDKLGVVPYALWSATSSVPGVPGPKGDPGPQGPPGTCSLPSCPANHILVSSGSSQWVCRLLCSGSAVDPQTDIANCGSCGHACSPGSSCIAGSCVITSCSTGLTLCGGQCVNLLADAANCGSCGNTCSQGLTCSNGACTAPGAETTCISLINNYRQSIGLPPYSRWNSAEPCVTNQAIADSQNWPQTAHSTFGMCGEYGQNECPAGFGSLALCLEQMWAEGPPTPPDVWDPAHGHYLNMASTTFTKVACVEYNGFWVMDFR